MAPRKMITLNAVRKMVFDMLEFANYSGDAIYDLSELAEMADGSMTFSFADKEYVVRVEENPAPAPPVRDANAAP